MPKKKSSSSKATPKEIPVDQHQLSIKKEKRNTLRNLLQDRFEEMDVFLQQHQDELPPNIPTYEGVIEQAEQGSKLWEEYDKQSFSAMVLDTRKLSLINNHAGKKYY